MVPEFNQYTFVTKTEFFFSQLDEPETLPAWVKKGVCNGLNFMLFRGESSGEQAQTIQRIERVLAAESKELREMAALFSEYKRQFKKYSEQQKYLLDMRVAECKSDKEKIKKVRAEHYKNIEIKVKEQIKNTDLLQFSLEFYEFISSVLFAFNPQFLHSAAPRYSNYTDILRILGSDKMLEQKELPNECFEFEFNFTPSELSVTLDKITQTNDQIIISNTDHIIKLKKQKDGSFQLYDSRNCEIQVEHKSTAAAVKAIKQHLFTNFEHNVADLLVGIKVFSTEQKESALPRPTEDELLQSLLEARGDKKNINAQSWDGATALFLAAYNGDIAMVKRLLAVGADVTIANNTGKTPIYIAAKNGFLEILEVFREKGFKLDQADKNDMTPIYIAAQCGKAHIIEFYAKNGFDVNAPIASGWEPAYVAAQNGQVEAIKVLMKYGLNIAKPFKNGKTILQIADEYNQKDLLRWLANLAIISGDKNQLFALADCKSIDYNRNEYVGNSLIKIAAEKESWDSVAKMLMRVKSKKDLLPSDKQFLKTNRKLLAEGCIAMAKKSNHQDAEHCVDDLVNNKSALGQLFANPHGVKSLFFSSKKYHNHHVSALAHEVISSIQNKG